MSSTQSKTNPSSMQVIPLHLHFSNDLRDKNSSLAVASTVVGQSTSETQRFEPLLNHNSVENSSTRNLLPNNNATSAIGSFSTKYMLPIVNSPTGSTNSSSTKYILTVMPTVELNLQYHKNWHHLCL